MRYVQCFLSLCTRIFTIVLTGPLTKGINRFLGTEWIRKELIGNSSFIWKSPAESILTENYYFKGQNPPCFTHIGNPIDPTSGVGIQYASLQNLGLFALFFQGLLFYPSEVCLINLIKWVHAG